MARGSLNNCLNALNVRLPLSVGASVGMGNLYTKSYALTAKIALCHLLHLLAINKIQITVPRTPQDILANPIGKSKS